MKKIKYKLVVKSFQCSYGCKGILTLERDVPITKRPKCSSCGRLMKECESPKIKSEEKMQDKSKKRKRRKK